ncbi:hypothetical protein EST38_g8049 [Candolleomyces aberdarensis]|uniref:Uncharacterized protein n=1 Tax=Candolleomyces aberdarensis TaxID=2316362 RepID=A0A4V1Q395_9AGAR|nr:hypothetical protein EST38_g8049 [Candolleomyces aberdarensis]
MPLDLHDSPISHLFNKNDPPDPAELVVARAGFDFLTARMAELRLQFRELEHQLDHHKNILSPWRRIPFEMLGEIFAHVIPSTLDKAGRKELIDLCLVCRMWCDAAKLTNRLWAGLRVELCSFELYPWSDISKWFKKSGDYPRTLAIKVKTEHFPCRSIENCILAASGLPEFLAQGLPISNLILSSTNAACFRQTILGIKSHQTQDGKLRPWDTLSSLSISISQEWMLDLPNFLSIDIPRSLTSLTLNPPTWDSLVILNHGWAAPEDSPLPPQLLQQLTAFHIRCNWGGTFIFTTLQHCTKVQTLTIDLRDTELDWDEDQVFMQTIIHKRLFLPNLRTLRLRQAIPSAVTQIFKIFKAPRLVNLDISFEWFENDEVPNSYDLEESFGDILWDCLDHGRQPVLRTLRLHYVHMSPQAFARTLYRLDSLTRLTLDHVDFDDYNATQELERMWAQEYVPGNPRSRVWGALPNIRVLELLDLHKTFHLENTMNELAIYYRDVHFRATYRERKCSSCQRDSQDWP